MPTSVFIFLLLFVIGLTSVFTCITIRVLWEEKNKWDAILPCISAGFFLVLCVELIINYEKITQKSNFKRVIETESPAVIDTIITKNSDNSRDTLYIYKFKD